MVRFSVASTIDTIVAELLKQKKADPFCPISIIVPHSLMARSINRKLLGSGRPLLNVYVETFYQHIARAVEPILLEIGRPLITHYEGWHLVHQASERLALKYFAVAREFSSYVHFLLGTINELRIAVPEAHIENALSALGVKGQEILHFYSAYLDGKGSCADYADMLHIYAGLPQETTLILFPDVEDSLAWVEKIALAACKSAIPITHQLSEHVPECRLKSQLFCAPEIRWTFREILRSGICLDQVALIAPTDYFKSILEEGKRLNIPIFCEEGEPFPPGARELFAAALEVINSDYDYRHLKRFLLLKQDFRTLRALIECGIAHGGDALRRAAISLAAEQANSSSLKGLLEQFSAIEKLKHDPFLMAKAILDQFIPESREKHFLLGALAEAAETIGAHEYAAWMATLADRFSRLPFSSPELKNAVLLTSKYLPGDFHHVFCLGVTEGRFPARVREDPILLDYEREMINEKTGGTLKTAREQNTQAAKSLQYSIACATKQWFASFPLMDSVSGDEYTPSFHL
ncbi:MAG TPA: hypothetical protein PKM59_13890, partial [Thermodesulfobacteriota bacterium]|nr:hypothetical protein [Thermodesulfobacteriota bacterium]